MARSSKKFFAEKGYDTQMQSFIDAIRKGVAPDVTIRDGVRATVGCLRMLESARTGMPCDFDLETVLHA
jgi:hypothetical protein